MRLDAESMRQCQIIKLRPHEIDAFKLFLLGPRQAHATPAELENLILSVVADDENDGNLVASGRPQTLNPISRGAFAQQREHRPLGPGELYSDRHAQAP